MPTTPLSPESITEALSTLKGWEHADNVLTKTFKLPSYMAGLAFASAIGTLAEGLDHHPDLFIGYKTVRVTTTTHDAGNQISAKDVALARAIDALNYPKA